MTRVELVFVSAPGAGHLVSSTEFAKVLVDRDERVSVTFLVMKMPFDSKTSEFIKSLATTNISNRLRFIELPAIELDPSDTSVRPMTTLIETQKPHVREVVSNLIKPESSPSEPRLGGFVLDMFCTQFIDVANEFGVPSYIFLTSGAAFLGLVFHIQYIHDHQQVDPTKLENSDVELSVPAVSLPLPAKVLPSVLMNEQWLSVLLQQVRRFRETKGIMVNTFMELESYAVNALTTESMNNDAPPVYPVGPILNLKGDEGTSNQDCIMRWLDDQAPSSVVFLCFGSMGGFNTEQVKEIALALERSGHRFLWSLRKPASKGTMEAPTDYTNPEEALPEGFLDHTAGIGKVIGWAPQVVVLAHKAIGGFVSHCGWNSTLESLWFGFVSHCGWNSTLERLRFGVPIAALPLYAEQQFNAFLLVQELGLGVEIKVDYRSDQFVMTSSPKDMIVSADVIERGIRCVMDHDCEVRRKVKDISEKSRQALMEGGSSHRSLGRLIEDVINNIE
ncbi:hypothetical protein K2173_018039 [Erythroxylum novogranatense]|uniref:anthocyanidin 3-O-glucosyltransferase n=1 Tax=Erythroxylum novogranatense TaxID=1862640 RepID=A0AAV8TUS3_9ROSI|nr:hypothetical protein K2173_018039 [Erythroxylum novogranatense]